MIAQDASEQRKKSRVKVIDFAEIGQPTIMHRYGAQKAKLSDPPQTDWSMTPELSSVRRVPRLSRACRRPWMAWAIQMVSTLIESWSLRVPVSFVVTWSAAAEYCKRNVVRRHAVTRAATVTPTSWSK